MRSPQNRDHSELDHQIDELLSSRQQLESAAKSDDPLLRTAAQLAQGPHPVLSAEARQRIHARIQQPRKPLLQFTFAAALQRIAAVFVLMIIVGLTTLPAAASSVPGDLLYPVKLGWENAELALARSDTARVRVLLTHANRRLEEQQTLFSRRLAESYLFERSLDDLNAVVELLHVLQPAAAASLQTDFSSTYLLYQQVLSAAHEQALVAQPAFEDYLAMGESVASRAGVLIVEQSAPDVTPESTPDTPVLPVVEVTGEPAPAATPSPAPQSTPETAVEEDQAATPEAPAELVARPVTIVTAGETAYVYARNRVNVRSGPGTEYSVIAHLDPDSQVVLAELQAGGEWVQIVLGDGQIGWIASYLLTKEPASEQITTGGGNGSQGNAFGRNADCENRGNSCDAPGQGNGRGNANGNTNGNNGNRP